MDSPNFFRPPSRGELKNPKTKKSKGSRILDLKGLRKEAGDRPIVVVRKVDTARAEQQTADAEAEDRGAAEHAIGIRSVFAARAVGVEFFEGVVPFGMRESHAADNERAAAKLDRIACDDFACTANRAGAMSHAELEGDDQNVALLLLGDLVEHGRGAGMLTQTIGPQLSLAVVGELALHADGLKHEAERTVVDGVQRLPARDGEPPLGSFGELEGGQDILRERQRLADVELREEDGERPQLLGDGLGARVGFRVGVGRLTFLALELVGDRQFDERGRDSLSDHRSEFIPAGMHALRAVLAEIEGCDSLFGRVGYNAIDLLDLTAGCMLLSKRRHDVSSCTQYDPNRSDERLSLYETA